MTIVLREGGLVARNPVPHDGDCGLWSGRVRGFVSTLRKHQNNGRIRTVAEKRSAPFGGSTMATALCARGKSGASYQRLGNIKLRGVLGQSPLPKKDPHRLEAARWRLRFVLGASQRLRTNA
jgi:hypothetical protein